jgi:hypothetical protein
MRKPSVQEWGGGLGEILPNRKAEIRCAPSAGTAVGPSLEEIILQKKQRETQQIALSEAESQNLAVLLANRPRRRLRNVQSTPQDSSTHASGPPYGQ